MLMKDGTTVPVILMQALENDMQALKVFMAASETYQKLFVMQIKQSREGLSMRERLERTINDIKKHGENMGM